MVCLMTLKSDAEFEKKLTPGSKDEFLFEKWHEEFGQFLSQQWKV